MFFLLGALVITPTRELAYQIFETLKKIGKYHDFSAGLVIGGKDLKYETDRLSNCNIIICTPGKGQFLYYVRVFLLKIRKWKYFHFVS